MGLPEGLHGRSVEASDVLHPEGFRVLCKLHGDMRRKNGRNLEISCARYCSHDTAGGPSSQEGSREEEADMTPRLRPSALFTRNARGRSGRRPGNGAVPHVTIRTREAASRKDLVLA